MTPDDPTLTPNLIVDSYERAFRRVYGREPRVRHIGGQWYYINSETVHRVTLLAEIMRLRELAREQSPYEPPTRSMVQRLIARLRGL
jgi:hypothetical protein